jgi:hypothetical protein
MLLSEQHFGKWPRGFRIHGAAAVGALASAWINETRRAVASCSIGCNNRYRRDAIFSRAANPRSIPI